MSVAHDPKDKSKESVQNKVVPVVKSATDFQDMSEIEITFGVSKD